MTLAWYGHLKILHDAPLWQAILFSWCIALLEYSFMIPATKLLNQYGWSLGEMKITQEVVTLLVFVPFMIFLFKQPFKLDYVWAMLCLLGWYRDWETDRKSTRLNSSHLKLSRMPSSA